MWRNGDIDILLKEIRHIQKQFVKSKKACSSDDISRIFAKLIMEGKISAAMKFLDTESSSGVLTLSNDVIKELEEKHPQPAQNSRKLLTLWTDRFHPKMLF